MQINNTSAKNIKKKKNFFLLRNCRICKNIKKKKNKFYQQCAFSFWTSKIPNHNFVQKLKQSIAYKSHKIYCQQLTSKMYIVYIYVYIYKLLIHKKIKSHSIFIWCLSNANKKILLPKIFKKARRFIFFSGIFKFAKT